MILYSSNRPTERKYAAIRYFHNRLHECQLHNEEYNRQDNIIHNVLYNNSFHIKLLKPPNSKQNQMKNSQILLPKQTGATFFYIG